MSNLREFISGEDRSTKPKRKYVNIPQSSVGPKTQRPWLYRRYEEGAKDLITKLTTKSQEETAADKELIASVANKQIPSIAKEDQIAALSGLIDFSTSFGMGITRKMLTDATKLAVEGQAASMKKWYQPFKAYNPSFDDTIGRPLVPKVPQIKQYKKYLQAVEDTPENDLLPIISYNPMFGGRGDPSGALGFATNYEAASRSLPRRETELMMNLDPRQLNHLIETWFHEIIHNKGYMDFSRKQLREFFTDMPEALQRAGAKKGLQGEFNAYKYFDPPEMQARMGGRHLKELWKPGEPIAQSALDDVFSQTMKSSYDLSQKVSEVVGAGKAIPPSTKSFAFNKPQLIKDLDSLMESYGADLRK